MIDAPMVGGLSMVIGLKSSATNIAFFFYPNNKALGPPDHEYYSIGKPHHLSPWTLRGYSGSWNCASSARQSRMLQCWGLYGGLLKQRCHWICQRSMESVRERRGPERGAGRGMIHGKGERHTMPPQN